MSNWVTLLNDIFTLNSNVKSLIDDVSKLNDGVMENRERIIKLEQREDLIVAEIKNVVYETIIKQNNEDIRRLPPKD